MHATQLLCTLVVSWAVPGNRWGNASIERKNTQPEIGGSKCLSLAKIKYLTVVTICNNKCSLCSSAASGSSSL